MSLLICKLLHLEYYWDFFFFFLLLNFISYFMLITLAFLLWLLPSTFFFSIMCFKTASEIVLPSFISVTISSSHFTLITLEWGIYIAQTSLLTSICFQSVLLMVSLLQSSQLLWLTALSLLYSLSFIPWVLW